MVDAIDAQIAPLKRELPPPGAPPDWLPRTEGLY
jgi:hypothetical protein